MICGSASLIDLLQFSPWDLIDKPIEMLCGTLAEHQVNALASVKKFLKRSELMIEIQ